MGEDDGAARERPTICLSMMVRNDAATATETLASVLPHIDAWVVVDTGSDDGTQDLIREFFSSHDVAGELLERKWRDLGANRSEALELCRGRADYAWVFDTDDRLVGDVDLGGLTADAYRLRTGTETTSWRPRIFRLDKRWAFEGVVHEHADCLDEPHTEARLVGDYHLESRRVGDGDRADDVHRRHADLLRAALRKEPDDERNVFSLAESLYEGGQLSSALQQYKRRIDLGGDSEEIFHSHLQLARCLERLGEPWDGVLAAHLAASHSRPARAEPLYEIARHHRDAGDFELAYRFASAAAERPLPLADDLFVAEDVYEWKARDERAISAFYVGRRVESFDLTADLLHRSVPDEERDRIEANLPFALDAVVPVRVRYPPAIVADLASAPEADQPAVTLTITTGAHRHLFEQALNSFLQCCSDVELVDRWIVIDGGLPVAEGDAIRGRYPFVELVADREANRAELVGTPFRLSLAPDWLFLLPDRYVSRALDVLTSDADLGRVHVDRHLAETLEADGRVEGERKVTANGTRYVMLDHESAAELARCPSLSRTGVIDGHHSVALDQLSGVATSRAAGEPARVRLVADATTTAALTDRWRRQSAGDGRWGDLQLVTGGEADYTVVVDVGGPIGADGGASVDPSCTIVVPMAAPAGPPEPRAAIDLDRSSFVQVRSRARYPSAVEWRLDWDLAAALTEPVVKTRVLSTVLSGRVRQPGERLGVAFVHHLQAHAVPIDVFGRSNEPAFAHHLGPLPVDDERRGILPYRYAFAAEDRAETNLFTERIIDVVLGEALCFYWGCPNLEEHLDPDVFVRLPLESPDEARHIVDRSVADDEWSRRIEAIRTEKRRIVETMQILPTLERTIRGHRFVEALDILVINLDRRPDRWTDFVERFGAAAGRRMLDRVTRRSAIDGRSLRRTPEVERVFRDNEFGYRQGMVGCALSHLEAWRAVVSSGKAALVLEDDVQLDRDFRGQLVEVGGHLADRRSFDLAFLGQFSWDEEVERSRRSPWLPACPEPFEPGNYLGGCFGYLVSPAGADRLVHLVERDGIQRGVDGFVASHAAELDLLIARPHLVTTELADPDASTDSDVQRDQDPLT